MKRKLIALLLTMGFLVGISGTALATGGLLRASQTISDILVNVSSPQAATVQFVPKINTQMPVPQLGFEYVKVYEKSGSSWILVKTFTEQSVKNNFEFKYTYTYSGVSGRQYYAEIKAFASNTDATRETRILSSLVVTAK